MDNKITGVALQRAKALDSASKTAAFNRDKRAAIAQVSGLSNAEIDQIYAELEQARAKKVRYSLAFSVAVSLGIGILGSYWLSGSSNEPTKAVKVPQLWTDIRIAQLTPDQCLTLGKEALKGISPNSIQVNGQYLYSHVEGSRLVVKCIPQDEKSLLFVGVAGENRNQVEKLRNQLVSAITQPQLLSEK